MKLLILCTLSLLVSPAFAWDCSKWISTVPGTECYRPPADGGNAKASSKSKAKSVAQSVSTSASTSNADASNTGVTTTYAEQVDLPRQTPPAFSGDVQPTTSCTNARNGGASSPVAALSLGFSTKDKECDLRETARLFYEMGQKETAVRLLCTSEAAKRLKECGFTPPDPPPYPPGERERRMREHHAEDLGK